MGDVLKRARVFGASISVAHGMGPTDDGLMSAMYIDLGREEPDVLYLSTEERLSLIEALTRD